MEPSVEKLKVGAVYFDVEENCHFICATDNPDPQGDVLVINFNGTGGYAHFELVEGIEKAADTLNEYFKLATLDLFS